MALSITKPTVGGSTGTWGTELNTALDAIVTGVNGNAPIAAKGDLVVATSGTAVTRVGVGTNGYALTADSTTSSGVAWNLPPGSLVVKCIQTSAQSFADGVATGVTFPTPLYLRSGWGSFSGTTFTCAVAGWYELTGGVTFANGAGTYRQCYWVAVGAGVDGSIDTIAPVSGIATTVVARTTVVQLAAGNGVALYGAQAGVANLNTAVGSQHASSMNIKWLGP